MTARFGTLATILLISSIGQTQSVHTSGPDPAVVRVGDATHLQLWVDDASSAELGPLPVSDRATITASPKRVESFETIVEGIVERRSRARWTIRIEPHAAGRVTIPRILTIVDGATRATADDLFVEAVSDESGANVAFLEFAFDRDSSYVEQVVGATLRFGFRTELIERGLVPLFRQPLDVPVQVRSRWLAAPPVPVIDAGSDGGRSFSLNGSAAHARPVDRMVRGEHEFVVFERRYSVRPTRSGALDVPSAFLRFAYATEFEDGLLEPVPLDRREAIVYATPTTLEVSPLPLTGRPDSFTGAVGQFEVHAILDRSSATVGDVLELTLTVRGTGNFDSLGAPRLPWRDVHELSRSLMRASAEVACRYEFVVLDAMDGLTPIEFGFFDPEVAGYRTIRTEPLSCSVTGTRSAARSALTTPGIDDIHEASELVVVAGQPFDPSVSSWRLGGLILVAWLAAFAFAHHRIRRRLDRLDPSRPRARRAAREFRRAVGTRSTRDALSAYLAARLRTDEAAVVDVNLHERLIESGVDEQLARKSDRLVRALVRAEFGGTPVKRAEAEARRLVVELEAQFRARRMAS